MVGNTGLSGSVREIPHIEMVAPVSAVIGPDTSGSTNGNVILQFDLLSGGYAGFDNITIVASDTGGEWTSFGPIRNSCVPSRQNHLRASLNDGVHPPPPSLSSDIGAGPGAVSDILHLIVETVPNMSELFTTS